MPDQNQNLAAIRSCEPLGNGTCWKCHYDLRGIQSGRCPECGWPYELTDVLKTREGIRWMAPTRWIGRGAIPAAAIALVLDAMLLPTPVSLLLLAFLWAVVATPYMIRSRQRRKRLFRRYPRNSLVDPDLSMRKRVSTVFLVAALIVWSGAWQRLAILVSLPWLSSYGCELYDKKPIGTPLPTELVWCGILPVRPTDVAPGMGVVFDAGFGRLLYQPQQQVMSLSGYLSLDGWRFFSDATYARISPDWYAERPPWNFLNPMSSLNR